MDSDGRTDREQKRIELHQMNETLNEEEKRFSNDSGREKNLRH